MYCGKWRKISKFRCDLDLDRTMPNVKPVRAIFMNYHVIKFQAFSSYCEQTHTQKHRQRETHTHMGKYSIVAVDKQQV